MHSFLKIKKTPGDIIILYHVPKILMIWSTVPETGKQRNRMKYIILGVFCSFHRAPPPLPPLPLTLKTKKIKILKWWKFLEISSCYACVPKITIIRCMVSEVQSETDRFFFLSFRMILKIKIFKKWEKLLKILSFYTCPP